ncbi:MAG: alpha/beta hydrolase [Akkermansiaceae bacterium]
MSYYTLVLPPKKREVTDIVSHWKKYLIGKWNWMRPIKSLAFIYLVFVLIAVSCSDRLIHQPPAAGYTADKDGISLIKMSSGEKIAVSYLPARQGMPTLLWSHGNAEDIGYLRQRHESFHAQGYGILAYDYPGYGISEGKPDEEGCYQAAMTAWKHVTETEKISPEKIIIYGQSVGSGASVWLATEVDAAGLILVSPFVSAFRTVTKYPLLPGDKFKNLSRMPKVDEPLLVIHGSNDRVISQWHGKKIYAAHAGSKTWHGIDGAGHNDIFILAGDEIIAAITRFRQEKIAK